MKSLIIVLLIILGFISFLGLEYEPKFNQEPVNQWADPLIADAYNQLVHMALYDYKLPDNVSKRYLIKQIPSKTGSTKLMSNAPMALSILLYPAFVSGHICAYYSIHPQDGFSLPYRISMWVYFVFIGLLSIYFLWKILDQFSTSRSSKIIAVFSAVAGSVMLNNFSIEAVSSINVYCFMISLYLYAVICFFKEGKAIYAWGIGLSIYLLFSCNHLFGVLVLFLLTYHMNLKIHVVKGRFYFYVRHLINTLMIILSGITAAYCILFISENSQLQYDLIYLPVVYPMANIEANLVTFSSSIFTGNPLMIIMVACTITYAVIKFRTHFSFFLMAACILVLFNPSDFKMGVQPVMVSLIVPFVIVPFSTFLQDVSRSKMILSVYLVLTLLCIFFNFWWINNHYHGARFNNKNITPQYLSASMGYHRENPAILKLLDTDMIHIGTLSEADTLLLFEDLSWHCYSSNIFPVSMESIKIMPEKQFFRWVAEYKIKTMNEEFTPKRTVLQVKQRDVKNRIVRTDTFNISTYLSDKTHKLLYIDTKIDKKTTELIPEIITDLKEDEICLRKSYYIFHQK